MENAIILGEKEIEEAMLNEIKGERLEREVVSLITKRADARIAKLEKTGSAKGFVQKIISKFSKLAVKGKVLSDAEKEDVSPSLMEKFKKGEYAKVKIDNLWK
jgi:ATP phosphoribosyltransferase regulatory subunit HisZ